MKFKLTTTSTPEKVREALQELMGHNADRLLVEPAPPPTITPHWLNKNWEYIPSTDHADASKFKERMDKRRKEAQQPQAVPTTEKR